MLWLVEAALSAASQWGLTENAKSTMTQLEGDWMQNQELDDILASLQKIVREAYALGRGDALKQVVEVLKADAASTKPLALAAPADEPAPSVTPAPTQSVPSPHDQAPRQFKSSNDDRGAAAAGAEPTPWWARQPRSMRWWSGVGSGFGPRSSPPPTDIIWQAGQVRLRCWLWSNTAHYLMRLIFSSPTSFAIQSANTVMARA
jgi:hypothetical protein